MGRADVWIAGRNSKGAGVAIIGDIAHSRVARSTCIAPNLERDIVRVGRSLLQKNWRRLLRGLRYH